MQSEYTYYQKCAMRARANRSRDAGARPMSDWSKRTLLRIAERRFDKLTAAILDGFPLWFLQRHFLREYSVERAGDYGKASAYYVLDKEKIESLLDDQRPFYALLDKDRHLRSVQGRLKSKFPRQWPRRYGLYRKYLSYGFDEAMFFDEGISTQMLARMCDAKARAYHARKRREEKGLDE